jgi:hypothetical protein
LEVLTEARYYVGIVFFRVVFPLLVTANAVPCSPILVTLMKEAIRSYETFVLARATWRNIPEGGILHSHRSESLNILQVNVYLIALLQSYLRIKTISAARLTVLTLHTICRLTT